MTVPSLSKNIPRPEYRIFLKNYSKEVLGIHHYYARFEFTKSRGQIHFNSLAMLGKKSNIIKLNDLVYKEINMWKNRSAWVMIG
jgi:hypothetical protein